MGRLGHAAVAVVLIATAGCGGGGDDDDADADDVGALEAPTFPEEEGGPTSTGSTEAGPGTSTTTRGNGAGTTTTTAVPVDSVSFEDPVGDATRGTGISNPPPWTDLAGGELERRGTAYRLTIRLGGTVPTAPSGSNVMNIASFYDVDGDGRIDFEIWVSLGSDGWGPVWYDDQDNAAVGDDSNVTVTVEGDELRLVFPEVMLDAPERLRFSLASEYGPITTIGTNLARRDDAPDDDRAVSFP